MVTDDEIQGSIFSLDLMQWKAVGSPTRRASISDTLISRSRACSIPSFQFNNNDPLNSTHSTGLNGGFSPPGYGKNSPPGLNAPPGLFNLNNVFY